MYNLVGKRRFYFLLSAALLVPGLISLLLFGLRLGIDFTGGSLQELQFNNPTKPLMAAEITREVEEAGYPGAIVQTAESNTVLIRTRDLSQDQKNTLQADLRESYGDFVENRFESVGPAVGASVAQRAVLAVLLATFGIMLYLAYAFRNVPNPLRYGLAAVFAMLHDVFIVLGLASLAGRFLGWEVDALFLTALLTVISFSVHDTIVVLDRVRENIRRHRGERFEDIINHSIIQSLARSVNTTLTTVFALSALALFGGVTIRQFVIWLLVGIISGVYSSIFNAAQILVVWENREYERYLPFLRRDRERKTATV